MRKTYSDDSRSAYAAEDAGYGDAPRRSRANASARNSRFDDFDEEFLAAREQPELDRGPAGRRQNRASRGSRRDDDSTVLQRMWGSTFGRCCLGAGALAIVAVLGVTAWAAREFLRTNPLFLVASSAQVQVDGNQQVTADEVRNIFGEDIGRNLFFIPISARQKQMESLPWVERASVERLLPNQIRVHVTERVPVAFAKDGDSVMLVDRHGMLLTMPSGDNVTHYSFPVVDGISDNVPRSTREARMNQYLAFLKQVDGHGEQVSSQLSEVDVTDPEDIQAVVSDNSGALTIHFGDQQFYERYRMYQAHLAEWQQQMPNLGKIDLSNAPQVVLGKAEQAVESPLIPASGVTETVAVAKPIAQPAPVAAPVAKPVAMSARTSAAKLVVAAEKPPAHPAAAHVVAAKAQVKSKTKPAAKVSVGHASTSKSAVLLRTKTAPKKTVPRKLTQQEIAGLSHLAKKPASSPAMQAFMAESPKPVSSAPRTVTRVHMPAPVSTTPAAVPQQAPAPKLVIHPGFNSSGGQP